MTLKPPTRTFPKLVMKEWPEKPLEGGHLFLTDQRTGEVSAYPIRDGKILSDFTRVLEGVEGQKETPLTKQESKHDSERT